MVVYTQTRTINVPTMYRRGKDVKLRGRSLRAVDTYVNHDEPDEGPAAAPSPAPGEGEPLPVEAAKRHPSAAAPIRLKLNYVVEVTCDVLDLDKIEVVDIQYHPLNDGACAATDDRWKSSGQFTTTSHSSGILGDVSKSDSNISERIATTLPPTNGSQLHMSISSSTASTDTNPDLQTGEEGITDAKLDLCNVNCCFKKQFLEKIRKTLDESVKKVPLPAHILNSLHEEKAKVEREQADDVRGYASPPSFDDGIPPKRMKLHQRKQMFAFADGCYYKIDLVRRIDSDYAIVQFYDGTERDVQMADLLMCENNDLIGHQAYFLLNGITQLGTIMFIFLTDGVEFVTINSMHGEITVNMNVLYLDLTQAQIVQTSITNARAQGYGGTAVEESVHNSPVVVEDVEEAPIVGTYDIDGPSTSGLCRVSASASSVDDDIEECDKFWIHNEDTFVEECDVETDFQEFRPTKVKGNSSLVESIGRANVKGNWFQGLKFLLTCGKRFISFEGYESVSTDNENYIFSPKPFIRDHLQKQILYGGGEIYDNYQSIPFRHHHCTVVISDRPGTTPNFLLCMRAGISLVSHEWVYNCTLSKRLVPIQTLPRGWSMERRRFILHSRFMNSTPFNGLKLLIVNDAESTFYKFWSKLCRDAGAEVGVIEEDRDIPPYKHDDYMLNYVLAPAESTNPRIKEAFLMGYLIVTTKWIVQSLICGKMSNFYSSPDYNYFHENYFN